MPPFINGKALFIFKSAENVYLIDKERERQTNKNKNVFYDNRDECFGGDIRLFFS